MSLVDDLQLAGTIVGITAACYAGARLTLRTWLRTIGSRRDLTRRLNGLACGATYEYAIDLLGQPAFRRPLPEVEECTWRMKHGWVCGLVREKSLLAFAITVTDPKFRFDCSILTFGQLPTVLGLTSLGATPDPESAEVSVGARRFYMRQYHYFGNPGGYQRYLLAYNDLGTGAVNFGPMGPRSYTTATAQTPQEAAALVAARLNTTANTLGVFPPMSSDFEHLWDWPGVDMDFVRTLHV